MKNIGGQAVIEGVMMRSPNAWTVAVRGPNKEIFVKKEEIPPLPKLLKKPVIRGVVALVQSLMLGIKAITYSAEKAMPEEEKKPSSFSMGITVFLAFVLGIVIFILLPLYATKLLGLVFKTVAENSIAFNLVDGVIRIFFFLLYVVLISINKDIKRVFQYHGAEHKTIYAHEAGVELTVENIENYSILHPRCGTSFLLIVMILSILIFSSIPKDWPFIEKFLSRVVLIPLIAGLSYEFIKFSSKKIDNPLVRLMTKPGLWLQHLTAKTPTNDQVEVAIIALKEALNMEAVIAERKKGEGNAD
ncbi:MAG: DUF1385 domain-containing protein [Nitrospirae bacterium]|nr:DUF1385 domain-containing protein [Nitrospirota bacterium]